MINKIKSYSSFIKYYAKTKSFFFTCIILLPIILFYTSVTSTNEILDLPFYEIAINVLQIRTIIIINIFISILQVYNINKILYKDNIKLHFIDKKNEKKINIIYIIIIIILFFILELLLIFITLNMQRKANYSIYFLNNKGLNIIYFLFFSLRYLIWLIIYSILFNYLYINFNKIIVTIFLFLFNICIFLGSTINIENKIKNLNDINIKVSNFFYNIEYQSLIFEIIISTFYILLFFIILKYLYKIKINKDKIIIFFKQIFYSFKSKLKSKKKFILFYTTTVLLIATYLNIFTNIDIYILKKIVGDISYIKNDLYKLLIILFHISSLIYLIYNYILEEINVRNYTIIRENKTHFIIKIYITCTLISILLRIITYLCTTPYIIFNSTLFIDDIKNILINNLLDYIFISTTLLYLNMVYFKTNIYITLLSLLAIIIIVIATKIKVILIPILLISTILIYINNSKNIIEKIERKI